MHPAEIILLSLGLAMDAFAVAVCIGLAMGRPLGDAGGDAARHIKNAKKALIVGLYFGAFQAGMPVIGFMVGTRFTEQMDAYSHIVAFTLLCFLGGKMIWGSFKQDDDNQGDGSVSPAIMLPLALATSIDALAVGVSLAFLYVNLFAAAVSIGVVTFFIAVAGVKIGNAFGVRYKAKAETAGGAILVFIGIRLLLQG